MGINASVKVFLTKKLSIYEALEALVKTNWHFDKDGVIYSVFKDSDDIELNEFIPYKDWPERLARLERSREDGCRVGINMSWKEPLMPATFWFDASESIRLSMAGWRPRIEGLYYTDYTWIFQRFLPAINTFQSQGCSIRRIVCEDG